jgi:hypothetical protein
MSLGVIEKEQLAAQVVACYGCTLWATNCRGKEQNPQIGG